MADRVVIVGGGPGGYEAAHVAAQLGAEVTIVDTDGLGGSQHGRWIDEAGHAQAPAGTGRDGSGMRVEERKA